MSNNTWRLPMPERDLALANLTGKTSNTKRPKAITQSWKGGKFTSDGTPLPYPGNTFLCHIDQTSPFFQAVCAVQDRLINSPFAQHFAFLPKPSFHMTIFCGVSGTPLDNEGWPKDVAPGARLKEINDHFENKIADMKGPEAFFVRPRSLDPNSIRMCAADSDEEIKLRTMRDQLRDATGLHRPDHAGYEFHVSMAYLLKWLRSDEADALLTLSEQSFADHLATFDRVDLGPVEFCDFDDMRHFRKLGHIDEDGYSKENNGVS